MKKQKLINVTSDFLSAGIFSYIQTAAGASLPWTTAAGVLDAEYYGNHSGAKKVSPLIDTLLKTDSAETLSAARMLQLANIIWNRYGEQWRRLYNVFSLEYNPIENYSMTETETKEGTNTGTQGTNRTSSGSNTGTQGTQRTASGSNTGSVTDVETIDRDTSADTDTTAEGFIYGYDSDTPAPSDKTETSVASTGTEDTTRNNTRTDNLAHSDTEQVTRTDNLAHSDTESVTRTDNLANSEERELTRSGNIGVTTSQQMITSEIELWQYDFFAIVYANIDKVLTIPVY